MAVKLKIFDPVIVARGPRYKDVGWGEFQFPLIGYCAEDGTIYASIQITEDSGEAYGAKLGRAFFASEDGGEHWRALPREEWAKASMRQALRLPNGERIRLDSTPIVRVKPEAPPQSASVLYGPESGRDRVLYRASDIPDSLVHKGWYVDRYDPIALISVEVKPDAREIPPCPGESRAPFEWRSGCGYSDMIPLDDRSALLVYTDFYVPDESGENRKTLLFRKLVVEE